MLQRFNNENLNPNLKQQTKKDQNNSFNYSVLFHAIFSIAGVAINLPTSYTFKSNEENEQYFTLYLERFSAEQAMQLAQTWNRLFGEGSCKYILTNMSNNQVIHFSFERMSVSAIKQEADKILSSPRNYIAHGRYGAGNMAVFERTILKMMSIPAIKQLGLDVVQCSDYVETAFIKMFGCKEELKAASFRPAEDFIGRMVDTVFYLGISAEAAKNIVTVINQDFPNARSPACLIATDIKLPAKGDVNLCAITVDNDVLRSPEFLAALDQTLTKLYETQPKKNQPVKIESEQKSTYTPRQFTAVASTPISKQFDHNEKEIMTAPRMTLGSQK